MSPLFWALMAWTPQVEGPLPPGCPAEAATIQQLNAALSAPPPPDLSVTIRYARTGPALIAAAQVTQAGAPLFQRRFEGTNCDTLTSSLVLSVALALDDLERPRPPPPLTWQLYAGLLGSTGPLPSAGLVTELGGRLQGEYWGTGLALRWQATGAGAVAIGEVDGALWAGASTVCGRLDGWRLCGAGQLGVQSLSGAAFARNNDITSLYAAGGVRLGYAWSLGAWRLMALGEGWRPFTRLYLTVSGARAWQTPDWTGALGLTVGRVF